MHSVRIKCVVCAERLKVRLVNGSRPAEGRLEVLHDGMWGSVCSRHFGDKEAQVVCRMLGYRYAWVTSQCGN